VELIVGDDTLLLVCEAYGMELDVGHGFINDLISVLIGQ
jgi:hypothetical protein